MKRIDFLIVAALLASYIGTFTFYKVTSHIMAPSNWALVRYGVFLLLILVGLVCARSSKTARENSEGIQIETEARDEDVPFVHREGGLIILGDKAGKTRKEHLRENVFLLRFFLVSSFVMQPFLVGYAVDAFVIFLVAEVVIFGMAWWLAVFAAKSPLFDDLQAPIRRAP